MSLRLTPVLPAPTPEPHPHSGLPPFFQANLSHPFLPTQTVQDKQISALFPFVKCPLVKDPWVKDPWVKPMDLETTLWSPQGEWVIEKTQQTTWHLYRLPLSSHLDGVEDRDQRTLELSPSWPPSLRSSSALLSPVPQSTADRQDQDQAFSFRQYLRQTLIFSCGAALSTFLYADPITSLKGLFLQSSLAMGDPTLTATATAFIETAQRQLYHLDRLGAQQTQAQAQPPDLALLSQSPDTTASTPVLQSLPGVQSPPPPVQAPIKTTNTSVTETSLQTYPQKTNVATSDSPLTPPPLPEGNFLGGGETITLPDLPVPAVRPGVGGGELLGVLEQGNESMALFQLNGTIERVAVGERLTNGATFTGTQEGKVLLQVGESQVPLAVGQSF